VADDRRFERHDRAPTFQCRPDFRGDSQGGSIAHGDHDLAFSMVTSKSKANPLGQTHGVDYAIRAGKAP
jgi:hypothetical protein